MPKGSFKSYVKQINKDLESISKERIKESAKYLQGKIKDKIKNKNISQPGQPPGKRSGDLLKGIKYDIKDNETALIGVGPPASHAHLLEFGTMERRKKDGRPTGRMIKRPFLLPTFIEESGNIRKMMSGYWL